MKAAVILALVFLLCHSSLQDPETPDPKFDVNQEIIQLHDRVTGLKEDLKVMEKNNTGN